MAADHISRADYEQLEARAAALGVRGGAEFNSRNGWCVSVRAGRRRVELRGMGSLAAVIAGALADWEEAAA